jgi:hypothetical protein
MNGPKRERKRGRVPTYGRHLQTKAGGGEAEDVEAAHSAV